MHLGLSPVVSIRRRIVTGSYGALLQSRLMAPAVTTALVLLVLLLTAAPDLTWANYGGDGAELITASATLGIPHPPGYPIYILLGKIASLVPLGSVAYRFNLLSAISLALAAGLVSATVSRLLTKNGKTGTRPNRIVPVAVGLTFAFIPLVWGQGLIAEVYTLNLFFLSLLLWLLVQEQDKTKSIITGAVFGLCLTTHLTSILFLPLCLYLLPGKHWLRFTLGSLMGILPFLIFPILANGPSPIVWGRHDALSSWLGFITARLYRPNVLSLARGDWVQRLAEWGILFLKQLIWFALPLVVFGYISAKSRDRRIIVAFFISITFYVAYSFGYRSNDAIVFLLPAVLLLTITLGFGMKSLGNAALLLPALLVALNFGGQYLGNDVFIRTIATNALHELPRGAIVMTPGDQTESTLLYYQNVEGYRPDAIIVDDTMFQFDWYRQRLKSRYPTLIHLEFDDVPGFIKSNSANHAICYVALVAESGVECMTTRDV